MLWSTTKEMILQASHGHVLVNQKSLIPISAVAFQSDKIGMVQQT